MRVSFHWMLPCALALSCTPDDAPPGDTEPATTGTGDATSVGAGSSTEAPESTGTPPSTSTDGPDPTTGPDLDGTTGDTETETEGEDPGPMVDVSEPQLHEFEFTPDEADPTAMLHLGTQLAYLDTTVPVRGRLVVYLHGAGNPGTCGSRDHGRMLAGLGFHVVSPCYESDYGVGNCGDDIGGCRLEAFEGIDHHEIIEIAPPDSIETRVTRALQHLQAMHPGGDWQYYIEGDVPRWARIVISGISHGASSSGVVGMNRLVDRVVMLSGPLDTDQAWLLGDPQTPIERFWGFTHTGDDQHEGHLAAFEDMQLPGAPGVIDGAAPPYGGSHRLVTSAPTGDGHGSTQAGGSSPEDGGAWVFQPVWDLMYTSE
jgi:hypothetical protein